MRTLYMAAAALGFTAIAASAQAAQKPGYSKSFDACMAEANSTYDMDQCNGAELKARDAALNAAYAKALGRVGAASAGLKASERAWIAYRDADCGVYENRDQFGTLGVIEAGSCMIDRTIERTKDLEAFAPDLSQPG